MNLGRSRRFRVTALAVLSGLALAGGGMAAIIAVLIFKPSAATAPPSSIILFDSAAPPALTEFAVFNCPHCRRFALGFLPLLRRDFIEPGLVEYHYRHLPFLHPSSRSAAEWSECARLQGRFDAFHDAVYAVSPAGYLSAEDLGSAGADAMLDMQALVECLESGLVSERVVADEDLAALWGVRGTPTLFLDGRRLEYDGYDDLRDQIQVVLD